MTRWADLVRPRPVMASAADSMGFLSAHGIDRLVELPVDWLGALRRLADKGQPIRLCGGSATSLDPPGQDDTLVKCTFGRTSVAQAPWLADLYRRALPDAIGRVTGIPVSPSRNIDTGLLLQEVRRSGRTGYELHTDSNPLTAVLFLDTLTPDDGGRLEFFTSTGRAQLVPESGLLLLYDARLVPHRVTPLRCPHLRRRTVVMNYFDPAGERRPVGLDDYLRTPEAVP